MGLILPGCVSKAELDEYRALVAEQATQIEELEAQIAALNSTVEAKNARITELEKELNELREKIPESETAKVEITFDPNPVPCENGYWHWRVIITEVNGIGIKFDKLIVVYSNNRGSFERVYDIEEVFRLDAAYLPAYNRASCGFGFPCQDIIYGVFTITAKDDNGNEVKASGKLSFLK